MSEFITSIILAFAITAMLVYVAETSKLTEREKWCKRLETVLVKYESCMEGGGT